jgi:hypothetical protein
MSSFEDKYKNESLNEFLVRKKFEWCPWPSETSTEFQRRKSLENAKLPRNTWGKFPEIDFEGLVREEWFVPLVAGLAIGLLILAVA